jgi:hypothetical protein
VTPASWFSHRGDAWTWDNLTTACGPCNFEKADTDPDVWGRPATEPRKPADGDLTWYFDQRSHLSAHWLDDLHLDDASILGGER